MILHHFQPENDVKAYKAMEQAVSQGKLKCIGLSNYYTPKDFDRLVNATEITPVLLQNETHPYHQSMEMKEHLNYEIFDFELTEDEMKQMRSLDKNERFADY